MDRELEIRRLVLKFHDIKNCILFQLTGIRLLDQQDFEEIEKVPYETQKAFLSEFILVSCDGDICIFCAEYEDEDNFCPECPYGRNHFGSCRHRYSSYKRIVKFLGDDIVEQELIKELIEEYYTKFLDLCNRG